MTTVNGVKRSAKQTYAMELGKRHSHSVIRRDLEGDACRHDTGFDGCRGHPELLIWLSSELRSDGGHRREAFYRLLRPRW
jgi:hypothetical protein